MNLLKELKGRGFNINDKKTKVHCKVFEDNTGAIEIAREDKYRPRTKHLNIRLHHFRAYVEDGSISIHKIDSKDQPADPKVLDGLVGQQGHLQYFNILYWYHPGRVVVGGAALGHTGSSSCG